MVLPATNQIGPARTPGPTVPVGTVRSGEGGPQGAGPLLPDAAPTLSAMTPTTTDRARAVRIDPNGCSPVQPAAVMDGTSRTGTARSGLGSVATRSRPAAFAA